MILESEKLEGLTQPDAVGSENISSKIEVHFSKEKGIDGYYVKLWFQQINEDDDQVGVHSVFEQEARE